MRPLVLSIAGSDPTCGAGVQADLQTISALGGEPRTVVTAITWQSRRDGVLGSRSVSVADVLDQWDAVLRDGIPDAVKIGMLGGAGIARAVAVRLAESAPAIVVLDPVLVSSEGASLLDEEGRRALVRDLLPLVTVATPNVPEARALLGRSPDDETPAEDLARELLALGPRAVVVTGGHRRGDAVDVLVSTGASLRRFGAGREPGEGVHGTGCVHSSALATLLAQGLSLEEAVAEAREVVGRAIREADRERPGRALPRIVA